MSDDKYPRVVKWEDLARDDQGNLIVAKRFQTITFVDLNPNKFLNRCIPCEIIQRAQLTRREIACGLHSGFPRCCVAFFVRFWRQRKIDRHAHRFWQHYMNGQRRFLGVKPGYVMCPRCVVTRNIVQVQKCSCKENM